MSLVKKLKDILFEVEDDDTEPIRIQEDDKREEKKKAVASEPIEIKKNISKEFQDDIDFAIETPPKMEEVKEEIKDTPSEKNMFTKENTFKFPDFDEEEFQSSMSRSKNTNVLDYERKKISEKKNEYRSYERPERDIRVEEKKKFKPSPIISPVYGILNKDYIADDIVSKNNDTLDIDSVRKKAFEVKKEKEVTETLEVIETPNINDIVNDTYSVVNKETKEEKIKDLNDHFESTFDEPVVSFFDEKKTDNKEELKSINELLESASDEVPLEDTLEIPTTNNLDAIEEELEKAEDEAKSESVDVDDTLDSDLFELIDSMYDDREEGN